MLFLFRQGIVMDFANQNEGKYIHVRSDVRKPYVIIWLWRNQKPTMPIHWLLNGGWLPNQHSTFSGGTWDNMLYSAVSRYWRSFTWLAKTHLKAIQSHKNTLQGNTITQKHTSRQYNHTKTHLKAIQSHKNTPQGNTITQKHTSRQYDHTKTHLKAIRSHKNTPQGNTITQKHTSRQYNHTKKSYLTVCY